MSPAAGVEIVVRDDDGEPLGTIVLAGPGGRPRVTVLAERGRERVEEVAAYVTRPRPRRVRAACAAPAVSPPPAATPRGTP